MNPQNDPFEQKQPAPSPSPESAPAPRQEPWSANRSIPEEMEPATVSDTPAEAPRDPLGDQINAAPAPMTQAAFSAPSESVAPVAPVKAKRSKKPLLIGAIAAAVLLIGGTAAAYQFWYQNPDKVVTDSLVKALTAKTMTYTGTLDMTAETGKLKVDFDGAATSAIFTSNAKATVTIGAASMAVNGSLLASDDGSLYFKVANAKDLANTFMQMMGGGSTAELDALVAKIDDKWIKVSADSMQDGDSKKRNQCYTDLGKKIETDKALAQEVVGTYEKQRFVTVKESLGEQNGSLGYKLAIDQTKAKAFLTDVKSTKLYAEVQKCDKDFKLDENEMVKGLSDDLTTDTELWVSKWSHDITKLKMTGSSKDGSKGTFVLNPTFNQPVSVTAPKDALPIEELQGDIESLVAASMMASMSESEEYDMTQMEDELMAQDMEL